MERIGDPLVDTFLFMTIKDKIRFLNSSKELRDTLYSVLGKEKVDAILQEEKEAYVLRSRELVRLLDADEIDWDAIRSLLKQDIKILDSTYLIAAYAAQLDIVEFLVNKIPKQTTTLHGTNALVQVILGYARYRDAKRAEGVLSYLLTQGVSVHSIDKSGQTPLFYAAQVGTPMMVRLILSQGANINHRDVHGNTPLMSAYAWGNNGARDVLLKMGADATIQNKYGETAEDVEHTIA
jgi:ankyrin repeat protein